MKRFCLLPALLIAIGFTTLHAQPTTKKLKKALELKIPREGGARAASVAWHPVQKKYYAAIAGNAIFSLGVYNVNGVLLSPATQKTFFDVRGLWYNPNTKTLQTNGYNDFGWAEYKLNAKGFPDTVKYLYDGMKQPDVQSAGAFDPKKKFVYFLNADGDIDIYDYKDATFSETFELHLGLTKEKDDGTQDNYDVIEDYNSTTVIFTGIPGAELGLLNYTERQIELYSAKDGYLVRKLSLPDDAPAEDLLCFAYANGIYWLFDREARIWKGYK